MNTSVGYFSGLSCATVNQTIFKYVNLTNEKPKLEMPAFEINLGEHNISIRFNNLTKDSAGDCIFTVPVALINSTGPL
jgi:hypothetical protein